MNRGVVFVMSLVIALGGSGCAGKAALEQVLRQTSPHRYLSGDPAALPAPASKLAALRQYLSQHLVRDSQGVHDGAGTALSPVDFATLTHDQTRLEQMASERSAMLAKLEKVRIRTITMMIVGNLSYFGGLVAAIRSEDFPGVGVGFTFGGGSLVIGVGGLSIVSYGAVSHALMRFNMFSTWYTPSEVDQRIELYNTALRERLGLSELEVQALETPGASQAPEGRTALDASTQMTLAATYRDQGRHPEAIQNYRRALDLWLELADRKSEATTLTALATEYEAIDDTENALKYHAQALPVYQRLADKQHEAETLLRMATLYEARGEDSAALEQLSQVLTLRRMQSDRSGQADVLDRLGTLQAQRGEFQSALDDFTQALPLRQQSADTAGEAGTLWLLASLWADLGEHEKALDCLARARTLYQSVNDLGGQARVLNDTGLLHARTGNNLEALNAFSEALPLNRQAADRQGQATTLLRLGITYGNLGEYSRGLDSVFQALPVFESVPDLAGQAASLRTLGLLYRRSGDLQKALEYDAQALPLVRRLGDPADEADLLGELAQVQAGLGDLPRARYHADAAVEAIESLRTRVVGPDLNVSFLAEREQPYRTRIHILMSLHLSRPADHLDSLALETSERSRARGLLDLLSEARAQVKEGVDPTLLAREQTLQRQLRTCSKTRLELLDAKPLTSEAEVRRDEQLETLEKQRIDLATQLQEVSARIRTTSPRYAAVTQPEPLDLAGIQRLLDPDTVLLEYSLGEQASYLWTVTAGTLDSYVLPSSGKIEPVARAVYEALSAPRRGTMGETPGQEEERLTRLDAQFRENALALSRMILEPARAQLTPATRVVIVADGVLQYIPFSILPLPGEPSMPAGSVGTEPGLPAAPLLLAKEVVHLPSASVLERLRQPLADRPPPSYTLAVFANPAFAPSGGGRTGVMGGSDAAETPGQVKAFRLERLERDASVRGEGFTPLAYSLTEAQQVSALVPESSRLVATGTDASVEKLRSTNLAQYRYLLFSTHARLDEEHPELSGLVLSQVNAQGADVDWLVDLNEVFNLRLNAEVVVLSACQTGLGKQVRGEGMVGLTRGFMYAGTPRVVSSLWSVDDQATAELMTRFFKGVLEEGRRPADALRQAQRSMLEDQAHPQWRSPYYWAGFVMQGEWREEVPPGQRIKGD